VRDVAPLLLSVRPGRGFASAAVDVTTRSTLTGQLLRGNRIVGSKRVTVRSGTQRIKVVLQKKVQRQLRRQGLKCVTLKLRIVVAAQASGSKKKTFTRRVVVRL
jgi:hypothetical protein